MKLLAKPLITGLRWALGERNSPGPRPSDAPSVLLVELTRLGDAVTVLYLLRELRASLDHARIHVLVDRQYIQLLSEIFPGVDFHGIRRPDLPTGAASAARIARGLRADLAISVSPAYRNAAVVLASGARLKAGYLRTGGSAAPSLVANPVEGIGFSALKGIVFKGGGWLERRWKVLELLGLPYSGNTGAFDLPQGIRGTILARLTRQEVINGRPHIVIHPFSSWKYRSWPVQYYLDLVDRINLQYDVDVVILCSRHEQDQLKPFTDRFASSSRVKWFVSDTVLESAVLMQHACAFVGNDSGPIHLASALGTPVVGVYGPSDPLHTAPPRAHTIYQKVECSPCTQQSCVSRRNPCLSRIPVDEVMTTLSTVIRNGSAMKEA